MHWVLIIFVIGSSSLQQEFATEQLCTKALASIGMATTNARHGQLPATYGPNYSDTFGACVQIK